VVTGSVCTYVQRIHLNSTFSVAISISFYYSNQGRISYQPPPRFATHQPSVTSQRVPDSCQEGLKAAADRMREEAHMWLGV
jgi:hypothetical protein